MVSVIIAAHNEDKHIIDRICDLLNQDYPAPQMEIILVSDGSDDSTNFLIHDFKNRNKDIDIKLKFLSYNRRRGKAYALNLGVKNAKGEFLVFTDARQRFDTQVIRELLANFSDPEVGCVSGELILETELGATEPDPVRLYWNYEKWIRKKESQIDSVVGVTGAIYAIRRELYVQIPLGTILDDVFIPMQIVMSDLRVIFDPSALCYDSLSPDPQIEFGRKVRTLMGNFQILRLLPELRLLQKNRLLFQCISHKYLRLAMPYLLLLIFISNIFLLHGIYLLTAACQIIFYLFAIFGYLLRNESFLYFSFPYVFVKLNYAAVLGLFNFLRNNKEAWVRLTHHDR